MRLLAFYRRLTSVEQGGVFLALALALQCIANHPVLAVGNPLLNGGGSLATDMPLGFVVFVIGVRIALTFLVGATAVAGLIKLIGAFRDRNDQKNSKG
jgi:hypothetical protein